MAEIRWAAEADIPQLVALGRRMHEESPRYAHRRYDDAKVAAVAHKLITTPGAGCVLVAEKGGRIVGTIAGFANEHWFGPDKFVADLAVFLAPEWRGGSIFIKMLRRFEDWAQSVGAVEVVLGISTGINPEMLGPVYERLGYRCFGTSYVKRFDDVR